MLFLSLDFWEYYLPYLYSCISFLGVLLLLGECGVGEGKSILGSRSQGGRRRAGEGWGGLGRERE